MNAASPDHWQHLKELFHAAVELAPYERDAYLAKACFGDQALHSQVEGLLLAYEDSGSFIESPAFEVAADLLTDQQKEFLAGQTLGTYKVISALGAGGMGEVYLAQDTRLGRFVALKFLPLDFTKNKFLLERLEQEARATCAFNHPNIVTIYEIGEAQGLRFMAMEFIEGETLRHHIAQGKLSLKQALDISIQIANALAAAHTAGIIHRDIKPENVMLRPDGYVKVLDFGLAKLIEKPQGKLAFQVSPLTRANTAPGTVMGTVRYMSPEQARGLDVDLRSDIYSLGVLIYEMVTGRLPFAGETASDTIAAILNQEPPQMAHFSKEVPESLDWIIGKALRKNKDERYQTVNEMLTDLKNLQEELALEAKPGAQESPASNNPFTRQRRTSTAEETTKAVIAVRSDAAMVRQTSNAEYLITEITRHKKGIAVFLALLLAALSIAAYVYFSWQPKPIYSIAVLPFVNSGADADAEYLADGVTENLINNLSQLPPLQVLARSTVFRYKGKEVDAQTIGRDLKVGAVLMGRIIQRGDTLNIQAELVDTATGQQIWGEQYQRKLSDILLVQDAIARAISQKLRLQVSGLDEQRLTKRYTENTEAYQLYLKGRYHWNKRTEVELHKSIDFFNQAIALDHNYALAYAGLSDAYTQLPAYSPTPAKEVAEKAKLTALQAVNFDDTLAEGHTALAAALNYFEWNFPAAEKEYKRALEVNPNYPTAHLRYGIYLATVGRLDESIAELRRTQELDPLSLTTNSVLSYVLFYSGQYDEALEQARKTLDIDENFFSAHYILGSALEKFGKDEEAVNEYLKAWSLFGESPADLAALKEGFRAAGISGYYRKRLELLQARAAKGYVAPTSLAILYARLGEKEKAFAYLEKAYSEHEGELIWLKTNSAFDSLRADARYQDLLRRIGFSL